MRFLKKKESETKKDRTSKQENQRRKDKKEEDREGDKEPLIPPGEEEGHSKYDLAADGLMERSIRLTRTATVFSQLASASKVYDNSVTLSQKNYPCRQLPVVNSVPSVDSTVPRTTNKNVDVYELTDDDNESTNVGQKVRPIGRDRQSLNVNEADSVNGEQPKGKSSKLRCACCCP